ncbi:hypothetical protein Bpfe_027263 [Biomphalaria pfeifferi]|uniref:Uncharacterized protein n=1 Tax=Biomphalaria pfeifferi TaxID=112525 RepID=A0AAD8AX35_BIOPF|nr:hypothetical protein Bpfe_027263 [Biomphalaria pfeifferi]
MDRIHHSDSGASRPEDSVYVASVETSKAPEGYPVLCELLKKLFLSYLDWAWNKNQQSKKSATPFHQGTDISVPLPGVAVPARNVAVTVGL